jgi:hypothetical protein
MAACARRIRSRVVRFARLCGSRYRTLAFARRWDTEPTNRTQRNAEVHSNTLNRQTHEARSSFAARSAAETLTYLHKFNLSDIVEQGQPHFNVVWVSEADFAKLMPI